MVPEINAGVGMFEDKLRLIGARIVYFRKLKGYNQQEFAAVIGLTRQFLSKVENGESACSLNTLYRIAEMLEVDVAELLRKE